MVWARGSFRRRPDGGDLEDYPFLRLGARAPRFGLARIFQRRHSGPAGPTLSLAATWLWRHGGGDLAPATRFRRLGYGDLTLATWLRRPRSGDLAPAF